MPEVTPNARAVRPAPISADFDLSPHLVIWETTQACDLACLHCRADARPQRDPEELTTSEARGLLERIRAFGRPLVVLTGGDPAKRSDVETLVAHGHGLGLRMAMTPSGTPLMTPAVVRRLAAAGLSRLALSLDGSTAEVHDAFRGVPGSHERTLGILAAARAAGLSTQVNTTITRHNLGDLDALAERLEELGIALWSVFFLVPVGRGSLADAASPEDLERVFHRMHDLAGRASFDVKSTAAPQYRRVVLQRRAAQRRNGNAKRGPRADDGSPGFTLRGAGGRASGVNDGNGFVFVSHTGEIYPSGFLPESAGNVRVDDLMEVYREHELFRALRDPDRLKGKCGVCEYRAVCGGSRARAWALTGDPLEADPFCVHVPARYHRMVEREEADDVETYFERRIPDWRWWRSEWRGGNGGNGGNGNRRALPVLPWKPLGNTCF